jgi:hypothetical protein
MTSIRISALAGFASAIGLALAALAGPGASASSAAAPCTPKTPTIKGNQAMALCGPATATVTIGGRTYSFQNGFCAEQIPNSDSFQLSLGTDVPTFGGPSNNAGQPFFSMDIANGHTIASIASAYVGGRKLIANAPISLSGQVPTKGTFKSKGSGPSFTGTWNCHGVLSRS